MPHVSDFIQLLVAQAGDEYRFGHEVDLNDPDPDAFDCSELIEWAAHRIGVSPKVPDGSWIQVTHCRDHGTLIGIVDAINMPGALLFRFSSSPFTGTRPTSSHVAVSLGDGRTIEARNTASGTGIFNATGRSWTHAALVPGLDYQPKPQPPPPSDPEEDLMPRLDPIVLATTITDEEIHALFHTGVAAGDRNWFLKKAPLGIRDRPHHIDWANLASRIETAAMISMATTRRPA